MAKSKASSFELTCQAGEDLARRIGVEPSEVRFAHYTFHNGKQWTVAGRWERYVEGLWQEVPFEMMEIHST